MLYHLSHLGFRHLLLEYLSSIIYFGFDFYMVVAVDSDKACVCRGWRVRRFYEQPPAAIGEARAALERILLAQSKGCSAVILEGDCKLVISAIRDKVHDCFPPYGAIVSNLISLSSYFSSCSCSFVKRAENYLAHTLAHI